MAKRLPRRTVVIVGGGLCAALASRQLTARGIDVLVLERGVDHAQGAEARLPSQRDELRWAQRQGLMQNWQRETYTLRHSRHETSLPVRYMKAFLAGEGVGGAASHWNVTTWRWSEYDPVLRTRYESRYGKSAGPCIRAATRSRRRAGENIRSRRSRSPRRVRYSRRPRQGSATGRFPCRPQTPPATT